MERSSSGGGDGRRTRATAHELARYEALFAARTRGMRVGEAVFRTGVKGEVLRAEKRRSEESAGRG